MKKIFCAMLVLGSAVSASAQIQTNAGVQYLQAMQKDMSTDFYDLSNTYFLADSLQWLLARADADARLPRCCLRQRS